MNKKHVQILSLILAVCIVGICIFSASFVLINGQLIGRNSTDVVLHGEKLPNVKKLQRIEGLERLDLRSLDIPLDFYDTLREQLPNCKVRWNVPFQGEYCDNYVSELTVSDMSPESVEILECFPNLKVIDARECQDYDALMKLIQDRPDLQVHYSVNLGDVLLSESATDCVVTNDNVRLLLDSLSYLSALQTVTADSCTDYDALCAITKARPDLKVFYSVVVGGVPQDGNASALTLDVSDAAEALDLLQYFPNLKEVTFTGLATDLELMYQMKSRYPEVLIKWDFELFGVETSSTATELILNGVVMDSTEEVENALKYFYNLEWVEMCQCGISSVDMDALWKRNPQTRFVWEIPMGLFFVRTDVKAFIPYKYGYNIDLPFYDTQAKELKYLVDLECLDLGHMRMQDISFLQYMPKLRFLILADVVCKDFSYMASLTNLEYIELFRSDFDDVQLLMNMKNLQDLNIGWTNLKNPELLKEMTWLKRLWTNMNGMTRRELEDLRASLPDTLVYIDSIHPTEGGWRQSELYYEMRDLLGMFYLK